MLKVRDFISVATGSMIFMQNPITYSNATFEENDEIPTDMLDLSIIDIYADCGVVVAAEVEYNQDFFIAHEELFH